MTLDDITCALDAVMTLDDMTCASDAVDVALAEVEAKNRNEPKLTSHQNAVSRFKKICFGVSRSFILMEPCNLDGKQPEVFS